MLWCYKGQVGSVLWCMAARGGCEFALCAAGWGRTGVWAGRGLVVRSEGGMRWNEWW